MTKSKKTWGHAIVERTSWATGLVMQPAGNCRKCRKAEATCWLGALYVSGRQGRVCRRHTEMCGPCAQRVVTATQQATWTATSEEQGIEGTGATPELALAALDKRLTAANGGPFPADTPPLSIWTDEATGKKYVMCGEALMGGLYQAGQPHSILDC